jgi:3'(2'), 5'-bisphosphate nucleotidase
MRPSEVWDELEMTLPPVFRGYRSRISTLAITTKPDSTLLTEADLAVQAAIVSCIRSFDPRARIVAEEAGIERPSAVQSGPVWVIDPIDGTREFVNPAGSEFCSVTCLLLDGIPVGCLILAPELGPQRTALTVRLDDTFAAISVNGISKSPAPRNGTAGEYASITREAGSAPRAWESALSNRGIRAKRRTTSQTLDLVRTAVDISAETDRALSPFAFFVRENQKIWDGVAGMALARSVGLAIVDEEGRDHLPINLSMAAPEPTFTSTLIGPEHTIRWLLDEMNKAGVSTRSPVTGAGRPPVTDA